MQIEYTWILARANNNENWKSMARAMQITNTPTSARADVKVSWICLHVRATMSKGHNGFCVDDDGHTEDRTNGQPELFQKATPVNNAS